MTHRKIVDYKILNSHRNDCMFIDFEERIIKEIKEGWSPIGGVCALHSVEPLEYKLLQAMVKYEDDKNEENKTLHLKSGGASICMENGKVSPILVLSEEEKPEEEKLCEFCRDYKDKINIKIDDTYLNEREKNILKAEGLYTIEDLLKFDKDLPSLRGMGKLSSISVYKMLFDTLKLRRHE